MEGKKKITVILKKKVKTFSKLGMLSANFSDLAIIFVSQQFEREIWNLTYIWSY